jgi:hypothetical protein
MASLLIFSKPTYVVWVCVWSVAGANLSSDAVCLPCPAGTFTPDYGLTACVACPLGFYSSSEGTENCTSCWSGEAGTCNLTTSGRCSAYGKCNFLKFRANPDIVMGGYLCQYSSLRRANTPEYPCTIPDPTIERKTSCAFEKSLLCNFKPPRGIDSDTVKVECWIPPALNWNQMTVRESF